MSKMVLAQHEVPQNRVESTLENVYICLVPILFFVFLALFVFKLWSSHLYGNFFNH